MQSEDGQKPVWPQLWVTAGLCWASIPGPLPAKNANQRQGHSLRPEVQGALRVLSSARLHLFINCWDFITKCPFPPPAQEELLSVLYPQNSSARLTETRHIPACPICASETEKWLEESKDKRKKIPITFTIITAKLHWIYQNEGRFLTCFWITTWQTWNKIKRSLLNFNSLWYTNGCSYLSLPDVTVHTAEMKLDSLQAISQTQFL